MSDPIPSKKEIVNLVEAQANSIDSISERLVKIELLIDKQDTRNRDIIYAVLIAFLLVIGTIAVDIILSNRSYDENISSLYKERNDYYKEFQKDLNNLEEKNIDIQNQINLLRAKNSYLK